MAHKYRKGDKVIFTGDSRPPFIHGKTYEVRQGRDQSGDVMLWEEDKSDWWFVHEDHLKPDTPTKDVAEAYSRMVVDALRCGSPVGPNGPQGDVGISDKGLVPTSDLWVAPSSAPTLSFTNQEIKGTETMATPKQTRNLVRVALIDEDAGLDVKFSLVKDFGTFVLEGSQEELIREILMDNDANVASSLRAHNAVRGKQVDLDIRQRTGNEVKLQEVKLKDLTWKVTQA